MANYSVRLVVREIIDGEYPDAAMIEAVLRDLLNTSIMPAMQLDIVPLSMEVKKSRKR